MSFNSSQLTAIKHVNGPMLVLAGPGSGKTTVITQRIINLVQEEGISPSDILVITFTKAAAKEMEDRYLKLVASDREQRVTFGTFHGIFFKILKYAYNFNANNIIKDEQRYDFIRGILYKYKFEANDENEYINNALNEISLVKNEQISIDSYYSVNFSEEEFRILYKEYDDRLKMLRLIDFDDMLVYCYELFLKRPDILKQWQNKYKYILIDEFQDINMLQYEVVKMLALLENNLFIVGDDDQSIYRFRGAKPGIMLNFPKDYPTAKKVLLDINYRSRPEIIKGACNLIKHNTERFDKNIKSFKRSGDSIVFYEFKSLAEQNLKILSILNDAVKNNESLGDYAIITRTNLQPGYLIQKLMEYNIPFISRDAIPNIYEHWIAKDIFAYINIALGSKSRSQYLRIINRPNRYVSRSVFDRENVEIDDIYKYYEDKSYMLERLDDFKDQLGMLKVLSPYSAVNFILKGIGYEDYLKEYAEYRRMNFDDLKEISEEILVRSKSFKTYEDWYESIDEYKIKLKNKMEAFDPANSIVVTTMHASKGLEFENVIIPDANEDITPHKKAILEADIEEERRMFYVAMTRAKEKLYIFSCNDRFNKIHTKSRFVEEILE